MLNSDDSTDAGKEAPAAESLDGNRINRMAFYPLTMPLTTGPGTITVAVSLGANRPHALGEGRILSFLMQMTLATVLLCVTIYLLYRYADSISRWFGPTGTSVITRLSAFLQRHSDLLERCRRAPDKLAALSPIYVASGFSRTFTRSA